jgi:Leucine-rich repeat (LRR) protein
MHTPDKRRWWSYLRLSLRGLMVLVLVMGGGLGVLAHFMRSVAIQREAVAVVQKLGGFALYNFQFEDNNIRLVKGGKIIAQDVPRWPKWLVDRLGPDYFGDVKQVSFRTFGFPAGKSPHSAEEIDEVLSHVGRLNRLTFLELLNTPVSDAGLAHLEGLANLRILKLQGENKITDAGLIRLKRMTSLKQLFLDDSQITDAGLTHLKTLTDLEELGLANTQVGDAGLAHLKGLNKLNTLDLRGTQVTSAGLTHLKGLTNLRMLRIGSTKITDTGIYQLRKSLPGLWAPR